MASQAALGLSHTASSMAALAIGHLLPIPGPQPNAGHRVAPDVAAVTADTVLLVWPQLVRLALRTVTPLAREFAQFDVLNVGEVNVVRLPRIDQPRHLAIGCDISIDERLLGG